MYNLSYQQLDVTVRGKEAQRKSKEGHYLILARRFV
jgi:hypothetical protein